MRRRFGGRKNFWEENVLSSKALARGYFKEETLRGLWSEHQSGKRDHGYRLWALLMLELFHRHADEALSAPVASARD